MPGIDINRTTENVINDPEISREIWTKTQERSFFMAHARRIAIPGNGVSIQTLTGDAAADWVAETGKKKIDVPTFGKKTIIPYKLAVIVPFSMEFMRDKRVLFDEIIGRLPNAIAKKYDETIMGTTAPGSNFDTLGGATKISLTPSGEGSVYDQFIAADAAISAADGMMNVIGLAPAGKSKVQAATDKMGYPLFTNGVGATSLNGILGATVDVNKHLIVDGDPKTVGIAGDFTDAVWGMVENISLSFSDTATLENGDEIINLWQQNMVAVKAEAELAFAYKDINEFVLFTE